MPTVEYLNYDVLDQHGWSVDDGDLFQKARNANLDDEDHGTLDVDADESILEAAEDEGYDWPYGCRQGMCASCASIIRHGNIDMDQQQILGEDQIDDGARVTCIGTPATEDVRIIYNAKQHL